MNAPRTDDLVALSHAYAYRWFAALFYDPPGAGALAAYRASEGRALLAALEAVPGLGEAVAEIRALASGTDLAQAADALAGAHARAFLTGGPRATPPYASVWLSERGLLYQEPAREMARLLRAAGLSVAEGQRDAPDHLSIMLGFMAELLERAEAGQPVPLAPADFLHDQLLSWVPAFVARLGAMRAPGPYAGLARALEAYLRAELAALAPTGTGQPSAPELYQRGATELRSALAPTLEATIDTKE